MEDYLKERTKEEYREEINQIIKEVDDHDILQYLYVFISEYTKGKQ